MLTTMIQKELRAILLSPKFTATFVVCTVLMLLSVFTGIKEYQAAHDNYDIATSLTNTEMQQETSWGRLETRLYREPDPMQILVAGLGYDIGRYSEITTDQSVILRHSAYSDDPIFAMFRFLDFAFIVQFVLTLLAILFTYDAVSGEREQGTLKLVFSNSIARTRFLIAKCVGAWLGLVIPIGIPILLSLGMILLFGINLTAHHWGSIFTLILISVLLFTFFIVLGVLVSTMTKRSNSSFLLSLVLWVLFVLIIPRSAIMAAGQFVNVPRVAEIDGQRDAFAADKWSTFYKDIEGNYSHFETQADDGNSEDEDIDSDISFDDEALWAMMQKQDSLRRVVELEIETFEMRLMEDLRQRKINQQRLAFTLSRLSPVSAYQLAAMNLAQTDAGDKLRWEEAMSRYQDIFNTHTEAKHKENKDMGGVTIAMTFSSEETEGDGSGDIDIDMESEPQGKNSLSISGNRDKDVIDLSDMPKFNALDRTKVETASLITIDFGIIILSILIAFALAYVRFLKYDLR